MYYIFFDLNTHSIYRRYTVLMNAEYKVFLLPIDTRRDKSRKNVSEKRKIYFCINNYRVGKNVHKVLRSILHGDANTRYLLHATVIQCQCIQMCLSTMDRLTLLGFLNPRGEEVGVE